MSESKIGVLAQKNYMNNGLQTFESNLVPWLVEQEGFGPIYYNISNGFPLSRTLQPLLQKRKVKKQIEGFDKVFVPAQNALTFRPEEVDAEVVTYVHDVFPYSAEYREQGARFLKPVVDLLERLHGSEYLPNLVKADMLIAASEFSARDLVHRTSFDGEVETVYQGVDDKPEKEFADERDIDLLYVGSLNLERKNPDFVRNVFETLHEAGFTVASVNFSGTGLPGREYVDVADEELAELYSRSRFYLHPSYLEGFGRGAVEAQRYGCIPLGLDTEINREVLGESMYSWIPVSGEEDVFNVVQEGCREEMKMNAVENSSRFYWEKTRRRIKQVLLEE